MSSRGTPNRPKSMALTPKMEQLRSTSPADYPCFKETGFYRPTEHRRLPAALLHHPIQDARRRGYTPHHSGRLWLLLVWRMKTRCPSPSLTAGSHPSHPPSALVRHHHMRQAPSRQARSRRKKRSLAGRELASCLARIQPTTRQVAPVSRRTDVVTWNPHHAAILASRAEDVRRAGGDGSVCSGAPCKTQRQCVWCVYVCVTLHVCNGPTWCFHRVKTVT